MPKSIRLQYCGYSINVYYEAGEPHHEPHVEFAKDCSRKHLKNYKIPSGDSLEGHIEEKELRASAKEIIKTYSGRLVEDWDLINNRKTPIGSKPLIIKKNELLCGLSFIGSKINGKKCIFVSYNNCSSPAIFDIETLDLIRSGELGKKKIALARKAIKYNKERWLENWENESRTSKDLLIYEWTRQSEGKER